MRTAVDTNVLSALLSAEPGAAELAALLHQAQDDGALVICGAVFAELCAYPGIALAFVDRFLASTGIDVEFELSEAVWREAARRFGKYAARRRSSRGSNPKRLLTDFIVGAHALVSADRLLTLDEGCYKQDFPDLKRLTIA
jgi:predicted nucleic acid-binding protein